jgi:CHAD domain-containing protein
MPSASVLPILAKAIGEQLDVAERAAADPSADGVHDLRVATRRLRAGLELWLEASPDKKLDRGRKALRRLGQRLGDLREADVDLAELSELRRREPPHAAAIEFVIASESRGKRKRAKALEKELRRIDLADLSKEIRSEIEDALDAKKKTEDLLVSSVARKEIQERLPRLAPLFDRALLHPTPASLHRLRIELKKFRYSVELCASAYDGRRSPHLIETLKSLQDVLGIVHDANALHARIAKLRAELRRGGLGSLERSLLAPMRAVASLSRERMGKALEELASCRRQEFFSKFDAALR